MELILLLIAASMAFLTGYIASQKNRDVWLWGFLGLVFGIFAVIAIAASKELPKEG